MLAVVHGLEKFYYYVYGRGVTIETDHKPLEAIFKKHLSAAPPHIARMKLRILKYDVDRNQVCPIHWQMHSPGSAPAQVITIEGLDVSLHEIHLHLNASP